MGVACSPSIMSLPVTPSSIWAQGQRQREGLGACGMGGGGASASQSLCREDSVCENMETTIGYGQPGSTGWLKRSESGGGRDELR